MTVTEIMKNLIELNEEELKAVDNMMYHIKAINRELTQTLSSPTTVAVEIFDVGENTTGRLDKEPNV